MDKNKTKIISKFQQLTEIEVIELAASLREKNFEIVSLNPDQKYLPTGIYDFLFDKHSYEHILEDREAFYCLYCLKVNVHDVYTLKVPIGVFGISPRRKLKMPIIINDLITNFIKTDQAALLDLSLASNVPDEELFSRLNHIKGVLIRSIFSFYRSDRPEFNAVMVWDIKAKASYTRKCAEEEGYHRAEIKSLNKELYHSKAITKTELDHMAQSSRRLQTLISKNNGNEPALGNPVVSDLVSLFYSVVLQSSVNGAGVTDKLPSAK